MEQPAETSKSQSVFNYAYHAEERLHKGDQIDFICGGDYHHATVLEVKKGNIIVIRADEWQDPCEERIYFH